MLRSTILWASFGPLVAVSTLWAVAWFGSPGAVSWSRSMSGSDSLIVNMTPRTISVQRGYAAVRRCGVGRQFIRSTLGPIRLYRTPNLWWITVPNWAFFAMWTPLPLVVAITDRMFRKRSRQKRGLCLTCGYDLTANMSGACPECGTACTVAVPDKVATR